MVNFTDALERKSGRQSFQPSVSSPVRSNLAAKPVKPCSLLEKHLRSPIETIINAAQRPNSLNSCTKLNNCRIIRESSIESSTSTKVITYRFILSINFRASTFLLLLVQLNLKLALRSN